MKFRSSCKPSFYKPWSYKPSCLVLALGIAIAAGASPALLGSAHAQAIVVSVNGDPVTTLDVEQRMKLLRAMKRPATRDAAIESMISDRLKTRESTRFGLTIKDEEATEELPVLAKKLKITTTQLSADVAKAGVAPSHFTNFLKAELAYSVLIRSLNRGVEASEIAVRQELAKEKSKGEAVTSYTIRQVVFTFGPGDSAAAISASVKQAEALRTRFTSCSTGIPYAKTLPGVAVRDKLTRNSTQLTDGVKDLLDKTPVGHLTLPSRSPNGIELIALCDRSAERNDEELRKSISERLLAEHLDADMQAKYKEMRAHAVIERR